MKLAIEKRSPDHFPLGALLMLPLFAMPIGGWLVEQGYSDFGTCGMKAALGIPCLTCGSTRATMRLLHGDLLGALSYQPMMIGVYAVLALWGLTSLGLFVRDKRARIQLNRREDWIFKASLVIIPLASWAYLIAAGI